MGRRLFAAFLLVALASLAGLVAAASDTAAGGWEEADLRAARTVAAGAGANVFVWEC